MFNAFKFTKQLEEVGFSREQAEIQVQVITEIIEDDLATKQDLKILESNLRGDSTGMRGELQQVESNLRGEIKSVRGELQQMEYRLIIKLGTLLVIGFTTMVTLMKIWIAH